MKDKAIEKIALGIVKMLTPVSGKFYIVDHKLFAKPIAEALTQAEQRGAERERERCVKTIKGAILPKPCGENDEYYNAGLTDAIFNVQVRSTTERKGGR